MHTLGALNTRGEPNKIELTAAHGSLYYPLPGRRTVPNVFVGGDSLGGADDTVALHQQHALRPLLLKARAL